jgi:type II secretion system protein N
VKIGSRTINLPFNLPPLPPWVVRYGRYAAYPTFGIFVFLMVLYLSLPWDRVKDRLELEAAAAGMDVRIDQMGPAFLFGLKAKGVTLRTRPVNPADKPGRFVFDEISAHPGIIGLAFGHVSSTFAAEAFGGDISGYFSRATDTEANFTAKGIDLGQIPGLEGLVKLPMSGIMKAAGSIEMPKGHLAEAKGDLKIDCKTCTIGDGKAKLVIPGDAFLQQGVTVPKIGLGSPEGKLVIEKGTAKITGFEGHSPDMDIKIEGDIALRDPWQFSTANLCLAFRPTQALIKREAVFELLGRSLDQTAKRADGYYTVRVSGRLDSMFFMPAHCGGGPGGPTTAAPPRPAGVGFAPPPSVAPAGMAAPPPAPPNLVPPPAMAPPAPPPAQIDAAPAAPPPTSDIVPRAAPARGAIVGQPPSEPGPQPAQPAPQPEEPQP